MRYASIVLLLFVLLGSPLELGAQQSGAQEMNAAGWATYLWVGAAFIVGVIVIAIAALGLRSSTKE